MTALHLRGRVVNSHQPLLVAALLRSVVSPSLSLQSSPQNAFPAPPPSPSSAPLSLPASRALRLPSLPPPPLPRQHLSLPASRALRLSSLPRSLVSTCLLTHLQVRRSRGTRQNFATCHSTQLHLMHPATLRYTPLHATPHSYTPLHPATPCYTLLHPATCHSTPATLRGAWM